MTTNSARLALPFIEAGQAQKEWTHNEALAMLDIAVQATVAGIRDMPPDAPAIGACWIVGDVPGGAWSDRRGAIAGWTTGGWRFVGPHDGMVVWHLTERTTIRRVAGAWRLDRSPAILRPAGGATIDTECRAAVSAILAALAERGWIA